MLRELDTVDRMRRTAALAARLLGVCAFAFLALPALAAPPDSPALSSNRIIVILQDHPDALAAAKSLAVRELQQRGIAVNDMTDEGLFSEIRADRQVRLLVSGDLKARGLDVPASPVDRDPPHPHELSAATSPAPAEPPESPHELGLAAKPTPDERVPATPHEIGVIPNQPPRVGQAPVHAPATDAPHEIGLVPNPAPAPTVNPSAPGVASSSAKLPPLPRHPSISDQQNPFVASAKPSLFARNFLQDQKDIWFSPRRAQVQDLNWVLPSIALTAGLFSADAELSQRAPDVPLHSEGGVISNAGVAVLLGGSGSLFLLGHWQDDARKRETGILAMEAAADAMVVDGALKFVTQRQRPTDGTGQGDFFSQSGINSGFPSAHSALAWSSAAVLAHEYPSIWMKIFAYGTATMVSYGRYSAQHHFPSDVVVGSLAGYLIGQHVYMKHHDPQLDGGDYGAFNRSVLPEERSIQSIGSPYVPLDSWVYPVFDRMIALGAVRSGIVGLRPWTRRECARLVEEASDIVGDGGSGEASQLYGALRREFAPEIGDPAVRFAQIDSIYARFSGISGTPLTDGYHFGQTIVNDFGRPYQHGFNSVIGTSASSSVGPLAFYVRGEFDHAPSGPGVSQTVQNALQAADAKPLIPALGPIASVSDARLLDAYASLNVRGWQFSFGRQSLWTSDTQDPFLWGDNAQPIVMFRIDQTTPRTLPSFLKYLGPYRTETWFGRLNGQHFAGETPGGIVFSEPEPLARQPFVNGFKINFKPTSNFEFGVGKTGLFGGPFFPVTLGTYKNSMFNTTNATGIQDPGDRRSTFDFTWRIPGMRKWLTIYDDSFVEDEVSPLGYPRRSAHNAGLYVPQFPFSSKLDFRFEGAYTNLPNFIFPAPSTGGFFYWNVRYLDGYTNYGNLIGNATVGRQGISFRASSTYWFAADKTIQLSYRNATEDAMFAQGGNLRDITLRSEWSFHRNFQLSSFLQYEWWTFPLLTNGNRQNDFTASFQLTYYPHWRVTGAK